MEEIRDDQILDRARDKLFEAACLSYGTPYSAERGKKVEELYNEYLRQYLDSLSPAPSPPKEIRYFLTFTVDPKKNIDFDTLDWWIKDQCKRKLFLHVKLAYEHLDNNMHGHVDAIVKEYIHKGPKGDFKSYYDNIGWIDIKGPISEDNGIHKYMSKEAKEIFSLDNTVPKPQWLIQKVVRVVQPSVEGAPLVL